MTRNRWTIMTLAAVLLLPAAACGPKGGTAYHGLNEKDRTMVKERLSGMRDQVELVSFSTDDSLSAQAVALYNEISTLQPKVVIRAYTLDRNQAEARELGVSLAPAVLIRKGNESRLRFFGLPDGYEFPAFIEAIDRLSRSAPGISARTAAALADLRAPVTIKVFTTST